MEYTIKREMTITHADFLRLIPRALSSFEYELLPGNTEIKINHPCGKIIIRLLSETERKLGSLSLSVTQLEFNFLDLSSNDIEEFLNRFDLCYRKGGG